jgi:hypothetical protein
MRQSPGNVVAPIDTPWTVKELAFPTIECMAIKKLDHVGSWSTT